MSDSRNSGCRAISGPTQWTDLRTALGEGDPQRVRALIEAGADIHYKRTYGHDALLDGVHYRDISRDQRLLELLALLVEQGVDLSGVSAYEESGLRVLSRLGRFDGVRLLLDAGADKSQLEWTPLMEAVALGSLADVQAALAQGAALEERDWWARTAWLIALLTGDIAKAEVLRKRGANLAARGRCRFPPLFYAIQGHHSDMLRWLLQEGADVQQVDELGNTSLIKAVEVNDLECVEILLNAGANVKVNANGTALSRAGSREIIKRLLDAGADYWDVDQRAFLGLQATADEALAAITPDEFRCWYTRKFGERNPERMAVPFWEAMIRCGVSPYEARRQFKGVGGPIVEPVWCARRFGQSLTILPDGRAVQIGGDGREHEEDSYGPDFCIYNDVFVHESNGMVAVYGYPESVFPPTNFHTATLVGDSIYVIGSLGYQGTRRYGETPVYRLDLHSLRMDRLQVSGEAPGWIFRHLAVAVHPPGIRVWDGIVVTSNDNKESYKQDLSSFILDLEHLRWRREPIPVADP
jgi:ankyrin repeat protein